MNDLWYAATLRHYGFRSSSEVIDVRKKAGDYPKLPAHVSPVSIPEKTEYYPESYIQDIDTIAPVPRIAI